MSKWDSFGVSGLEYCYLLSGWGRNALDRWLSDAIFSILGWPITTISECTASTADKRSSTLRNGRLHSWGCAEWENWKIAFIRCSLHICSLIKYHVQFTYDKVFPLSMFGLFFNLCILPVMSFCSLLVFFSSYNTCLYCRIIF